MLFQNVSLKSRLVLCKVMAPIKTKMIIVTITINTTANTIQKDAKLLYKQKNMDRYRNLESEQ